MCWDYQVCSVQAVCGASDVTQKMLESLGHMNWGHHGEHLLHLGWLHRRCYIDRFVDRLRQVERQPEFLGIFEIFAVKSVNTGRFSIILVRTSLFNSFALHCWSIFDISAPSCLCFQNHSAQKQRTTDPFRGARCRWVTPHVMPKGKGALKNIQQERGESCKREARSNSRSSWWLILGDAPKLTRYFMLLQVKVNILWNSPPITDYRKLVEMDSKMSEVLQFNQMSMRSALDFAGQACKDSWVCRVLGLEAETGLFVRNGDCLIFAPLPVLWGMQIV